MLYARLGEGLGVQPVEQLKIHAEAAKRVLRGVDVDVAHAGHDQLVAAIDHGKRGEALGQLGEHAGAFAPHADQVAAGRAGHLLRAHAVAHVSFKDE